MKVCRNSSNQRQHYIKNEFYNYKHGVLELTHCTRWYQGINYTPIEILVIFILEISLKVDLTLFLVDHN